MYIKLNFTKPQPPSIFFEAIYIALANSTGVNAITNLAGFRSAVDATSGALKTEISTLDSSSEIVNQSYSPLSLPTVNYYTGDAIATPSKSSLTIKFTVYDASTTSWLQITPTTFTHSDGNAGNLTLASNATTTNATAPYIFSSGKISPPQTWNSAGPTTSYSYFAYISPYAIAWASSKSTLTKSGWNTTSGPWANTVQNGPYLSTQYTRLDAWNSDGNGVIPVCWINGYSASYRSSYYGLSYTGDMTWPNSGNYTFNPAFGSYATASGNAAFSVMNTINASARSDGNWVTTDYGITGPTGSSNYNAGVQVSYGTHIRGYQDQTPLTNTNILGSITGPTQSFTVVNPKLDKTTVVENSVSRSAFYGIQGAALFDQSTLSAQFFRWPGITGPTGSSQIVASYILQPIVWNRVDYNNIGGLITDKAGVYLFNGDFLPGDEFTVSSSGITYSIWPLADGWSQRIGFAVPKK
jgi:hypothetical protein